MIAKTLAAIAAALLLCTPAQAALIHQYTFDSGPVAIDSVGGANGTLFGGAAIVGGELSLNGTSAYVQTLGNHIVPTSGDFTVSLFAKQTAFGPAHVELISEGATFGIGFYLGYDPAHNIRVTDAHPFTGIPFPTDGLYHNYALTLLGTAADLYIDGSLVGSFIGLARGVGGTDTRFGRQFAPFDEFFNGFMDNVRVFDTALSAAEVAAIANQVPEPGSIALLALGLAGLGFRTRKKA